MNLMDLVILMHVVDLVHFGDSEDSLHLVILVNWAILVNLLFLVNFEF